MIAARALTGALLLKVTAATPLSAARASAGPAGNTVTLITGDRVMVAGKGYRVTPGPGREVTRTRSGPGGLGGIPSRPARSHMPVRSRVRHDRCQKPATGTAMEKDDKFADPLIR
ncbi:hypothetical protein [Nonomuraea sp. NPDC049129]|uniref:hypothetical protein n=1 Tax=Nonomuraea sp. NPDC049129 TaxID=3155272 RepID=UPI0033C5EC1F